MSSNFVKSESTSMIDLQKNIYNQKQWKINATKYKVFTMKEFYLLFILINRTSESVHT